jgi:hypothetical protein
MLWDLTYTTNMDTSILKGVKLSVSIMVQIPVPQITLLMKVLMDYNKMCDIHYDNNDF